ncbi:BrnT family toxin [Crenothrix sp.]|uniref:BrnT family toxin n=1 Tax=Crenothrix sp. TaxID=3100433 RepID=UPI00374CACBE
MQYNFEWDPNKAQSNIEKHGVTFEEAAEVFLDALHIPVFDFEHNGIEERWITLGKNTNERILVVVHTFQEHNEQMATVRLISARKATKYEQQQYEENP